MSNHQTLKDLPSVISSQESEGGVERYNSRGGVQTDLFGQEVLPANLSQQPGNNQAKTTSDTSGLSSSISSASADLQQSLASKLRQQLDLDGLTIYKGTWKEKTTPQQRLYFQAVVSQPRTKGTDSSSWPTPRVADTNNLNNSPTVVQARVTKGRATVAEIASHNVNSWPTPAARDVAGKSGAGRQKRKGNPSDTVPNAAATVPWATPNTMDHMKQRSDEALARAKQKAGCSNLKDQIPYSGEAHKSSTAETESIAPSQLNPRFSLWLMGYPIEWAYSGERVTPLSRKRQQKS